MNIQLSFTAQLKEIAGHGVVDFPINKEEKLQDVIHRIGQEYGKDFINVLYKEDGSFRNSNLIIINSSQSLYEEDCAINDGDEIILMSPIAGG